LGCCNVNFHVSLDRADQTAIILAEIGAKVDKRIYPTMGHTVHRSEG